MHAHFKVGVKMGSPSALLVLLLCCCIAADSFAFVLRKRSWDTGETNRLSDALDVLQRERRRLEQQRDYGSPEEEEEVEDYPVTSDDEEKAEEILRKIFEGDANASNEEEREKEEEEEKENDFAEKLLQVLKSDEAAEESKNNPSYEFRASPANLNELENILKPSEDEEKSEEKKAVMRKRGDTAENMVEEENDDDDDKRKRAEEDKREYDPSDLAEKKSDDDSKLDLNQLTSRDINQLMSQVESEEEEAIKNHDDSETVDGGEIMELLKEVEENSANNGASSLAEADEEIPEQTAELVDLSPGSSESIPSYPAREVSVDKDWFIKKFLENLPENKETPEMSKRSKKDSGASILDDPELRDLLTRIYLKEQLEDDENTNLANALNLATLSQLRGTNEYLPKQFDFIQKAISDEEALQKVEDLDDSAEAEGDMVAKRSPVQYEIAEKRESPVAESYPVAPPRSWGRMMPGYEDDMGKWYDEPVDIDTEDLTSEEEEMLNPFLRKLMRAYKSGKLNPFIRDLLDRIRSAEAEEIIEEAPPKRSVIQDIPQIDEDEEQEREEEEEVANALADYLAEASPVQDQCPQIDRVTSDCQTTLGLKLDDEARDLCRRHEVCYACGASFGGAQLSRDQCDQGFLAEANRLCSEDDRCKEDAAVLFLSMQQRHLYVPYAIDTCRATCLLDFVIGETSRR